MTRKLLLRVVLALVVAMSVTVLPATAQEPDRERRSYTEEEREAMMERIRAYMARTIQERLELDDAASENLSQVIQQYDRRRRALGRAESQVRRRVEEVVEQSEPDNELAAELLADMASLQRQESDLFAEEQAALLEVLTPLQVLQLQELREDMGRRIRSLRGRYEGDGRRGRGGDDGRRRGRGGG